MAIIIAAYGSGVFSSAKVSFLLDRERSGKREREKEIEKAYEKKEKELHLTSGTQKKNRPRGRKLLSLSGGFTLCRHLRPSSG